MKRLYLVSLYIIAFSMLANLMIACEEKKEEPIVVEGVTVTPDNVSLFIGQTAEITAVVNPSNAPQEVIWISSNPEIATVEDGIITAVEKGTATITLTSVADETKTATIAVAVEVPIKEVIVTLTQKTLRINQIQQLIVKVEPSFAKQDVTYTSDNLAVATVNNKGLVTAVGLGTAIITIASVADTTKTAIVAITVELLKRSYEFSNGVISSNVLESYLSRAITQMDFLDTADWYPDKDDDDSRMLLNIGAKFIGRSICTWSNYEIFNRPDVWEKAKLKIAKMHEKDADMVFQAAIFEIVMDKANAIPVPAWVFEAFNLPVEHRNFVYEDMLNQGGYGVNYWANRASIPDISRQETRLFFYYMACIYMETGIEAIHFGQVMLMAEVDKNNKYTAWRELIGKVREAAKTKARRGTILCDAHLSGIVIDGQSLFDFVSYPMRPKEILAEPQKAILEKYYIDSMYGRTLGGITPSGWSCDRLPYIVEVDNFGISNHPDVPDINNNTVWGYDEISWFARQPEQYRNEFLEYASNWIAKIDPIGFIQMPGARNTTPSPTTDGIYRANTKSATCPDGQNQEETIKKIWNK